MDKPLALEYSRDKKWYTYKMFEYLQCGQSDNQISKDLSKPNKYILNLVTHNSGEEDKGEQNDQSSSDNIE